MLGLVIGLVAVTAPLDPPSTARHAPVASRITVRIRRGVAVSKQTWERSSRKIEKLITDEQGRKIRLRLVEFE